MVAAERPRGHRPRQAAPAPGTAGPSGPEATGRLRAAVGGTRGGLGCVLPFCSRGRHSRPAPAAPTGRAAPAGLAGRRSEVAAGSPGLCSAAGSGWGSSSLGPGLASSGF